MQIRNLKEYITAISKKTSLENLWKSEGSFLSHIAGDKTNIKQYIGLITNFATHTGSQFFYELLQNADDAESDSVFIHFSPSAMVVINNGLPFYTDISEKGRKGQLLGFLQKQKGEKYDDPDSIGKNGQGSKLLYDLLLPVHDQKDKVSVDKENALQRAIIEEKKGPIIFSWREHTSFERLLTWNRGPFHPQSCDNDQHPLLTKIFYTCYPAMPGEELLNITGEKVCAFEHGELEFCVRYLNDIKHLFNQFKFYRGTLLFIPLGDRQYINLEKIHSNELIHGISTSLAFLKNLKEVKVIDKTFQKTSFNFRSIPSIESEDGNSFDISIAYPVDPRQEKYSFYNFFQFFPVTQTKFGLKYIINSKVYGIDGARQRIDLEYHRNIQAINAISLSIDEYINKCKEEEEKEDLVNLIKCLVCSDLPLLEQNPMIKDLLYDRPKRSIIENLPLVNGFADSIGGARVKNTGIDISPSDLGFEGWDWLTEDLQDYYDEIIEQLDIKPLTITDLLCECPDREKLDDWMDGLAEDIYLHLVAEVIESKGLKPIQGIPIARFSDGETYTLDEVLAEETLLLITPELAPLASILLSQGLVCGGKELFQNPQMAALIDSYGKFKKQEYLKRIIGAISPLQLERNDKWTVFKTLKKIVYAKSLLRDDLLLFENTGGEKRPFKKLMFDVSEIAPSGLLALYLLKASEFLNGEEMDTWLMQEDEIWDNLVEDWESIRPELDGELDFNQMVSEMSNIYQEVLLGIKLSSELPWIHTDTNEWSNSKSIFFSNQLKDYSPDDYTIQVKIVQLVTELKTIPYEYIATLDSIKFAELPNIGFAQLKEKWGEHSLILGKRELTVFLKLKKTGEEFFENFLISSNEQPDSYIIELNDRKSKQYYSTDSILNEFLREKEKYYLLPQALFSIFNNTSSLQIEDENFASDLIGGFGAQEAFIDLVNRQSDQVKLQYLKALQRIDLYTDDGPNSYKNTFEGKVIDLICKKGWADTYRKKIYINNRPINEFNYDDRVEFYLDAEKKETKFEFSLASLIKKFEGISDTLSEVKKKLSGLSYKEIFSESGASPISDIPGQILPLDDEEQVAFLVSYYKSDLGSNSYNLERFKQRDFSAIDRGRLLSSFERHKIDFFSSFPLPEEWGLNLSVYLWPSDTILALDEERPKDWIIQWTQGGMPPDCH